ncbi:MAG: sulfatase family protein [Planctomycetaceae bacterium]
MNRVIAHLGLVAGIFAAALGMGPIQAAEQAPANIVLFLADDLGWADCPIYFESGLSMPNLERLARDGMTFTHAFVASPSCAPSRAALLTGLSPPRNGALFNHTQPDKEHKRWPAWFHDLGYETVAIGKVAHYASVVTYGFDHASHYNFHQDDCIAAAVDWLGNRKSTKPLCLLVGTNWPHTPWPKTTDYAPHAAPLPPNFVDTPETRHWRSRYVAGVAAADRDLGLVYDAVRKHLGENTLFLFTSDHGAQFPFGKWNCYDTGIRTPLVAVWPGKIAPGTRTDALVSWIDLLPTCLEAAGGAPPATGTDPGQISGKSFLAVLRGTQTEHRDRVFTTHSGDSGVNDYPIRSVQSRRWKYIRNLAPETEYHSHIDVPLSELTKMHARFTPSEMAELATTFWPSWIAASRTAPTAAAIVKRYHQRPAEELYDLAGDPWEERNLAADPAYAERLASFRRELDDWMRDQDDLGLPTENVRRPRPQKRP